MSEDQGPIFVAMRAADAEIITAGSTMDRKCSKCEAFVALAPSGVRFLKKHPEALIICKRCFQPRPDDEHHMAATPQEMVGEMLNAKPNTYRNRN